MSNSIRDAGPRKRDSFMKYSKKIAPVALLSAFMAGSILENTIDKSHASDTPHDSARNYLLNQGCDVTDYDRGLPADCSPE